MSNFKIESILPASTLEVRIIKLPLLPLLNFNVQSMPLLTYDLAALLDSVSDFLKGQNNSQLLSRTLRVLGASLNDKKLSGGLEEILLGHEKKRQRVYELMIIWSQCCNSLVGILQKVSAKLRTYLAHLIVESYFLDMTQGESQLRRQLSQVVAVADQTLLAAAMLDRYLLKGEPLSVLIIKSRELKTQSPEMLILMRGLLKMAVERSDGKVLNMVQRLPEHQESICYLLKELPNLTTTLIRHLRKTIDLDNVFKTRSISSEFEPLLRSATKEWLDEGHHYWQSVDKHYEVGGDRTSSSIR